MIVVVDNFNLIIKNIMENKCFMCECTSNEKVLVAIEKDSEAKFVCVGCLPTVIHWER